MTELRKLPANAREILRKSNLTPDQTEDLAGIINKNHRIRSIATAFTALAIGMAITVTGAALTGNMKSSHNYNRLLPNNNTRTHMVPTISD